MLPMIETTTSLNGENNNVIPVHLDANFFFERAVRSMDRFQYDKALKNFRKAVEYEPDNPVNHCNMAGILSEMGDYEASNNVLSHVLEHINPAMTECHFYMANNYANMESYEEAEQALVKYLEEDPEGDYLAEAEELMDLLYHELNRPAPLRHIRSREGIVEHDRARTLLEEGKFTQAIALLEEIIAKTPDFLAAYNNLALAYYYQGRFGKAKEYTSKALELEPGNLHALCNMAIFLHYEGGPEAAAFLRQTLEGTVPFHEEHVFKLATTMGILGSHRAAFGHFRRLLKNSRSGGDAELRHYCAAAACNSGLYAEALRCWAEACKLDPDSSVPRFYLEQLRQTLAEGASFPTVSYNYQLPFEERLKRWRNADEGFSEELARDPLLRASFFWALRYGGETVKRQILQAVKALADPELADELHLMAKQAET